MTFIAKVLTIFFCLNAAVFAAEGRWTEGVGQGNLEYFIDKDGYRLYIGCPTENGSTDMPSSISVSDLSSGQDVPKFKLVIDGQTVDGPFDANSRVMADWFIAAIRSFRKQEAVVKVGMKTIRFPKSNAAHVLPNPDKGLACNLY